MIGGFIGQGIGDAGYRAPVAALAITAETGVFTLTGQAVGLRATRTMAAGAGSFILTGQAVNLRATRKITAEAGSFLLTGQNVGLLATRRMSAATGAFVLTGQAVNLLFGHRVVAERGGILFEAQLAQPIGNLDRHRGVPDHRLRRRHSRRLRLPVHITEALLVVEDSLEGTVGTM